MARTDQRLIFRLEDGRAVGVDDLDNRRKWVDGAAGPGRVETARCTGPAPLLDRTRRAVHRMQ
ncbi:MAG: hypothetical protein OXF33_09110 [Rhodospirillales bacterium]|nr:hypothetical protein [Rhodospirillales bacterium]